MISLNSSQELDIDTDSEEMDEDENENTITQPTRSPQLRSFVWEYFKDIPDNPHSKLCSICNLIFANKSTNLARHLLSVHKIKSHTQKPLAKDENRSGRRTSSFIWKYCNRINDRQALCLLCNKLFYFGGGNTTNITKHLRRKHAGSIEYFTAESPKKDRKTTSYVWNYITKLPGNQVRCSICLSKMRFHGTANLIKHLSTHKIMGDKTSPDDPQAKSTDDPMPSKEHFKCEMCSMSFDDVEDVEEQISTHMLECHSMQTPVIGTSTESIDESQSNENVKEVGTIWNEDNNETHQDLPSIIDDETLYNDLIEEDLNSSANLAAPLDCEATTSISENPTTIEVIDSLEEDDEADLMSIEDSEATSRLIQLKEELLRQKTNYFNEKAGYYRMQKYLVALQVKKERLEFEMLSKSHNQIIP
ncbi:uncharacterized protein [Drosophila tropicalis]|uniref:uncharacterized protein n=1 Tax=Drosophila tropicalis TaxID=46794 RepID=UPI0035ABBB4E